jgi:hypothetical protein
VDWWEWAEENTAALVDAFWPALQRLSWAVSIVGITAIAWRLLRRPKVVIGLYPMLKAGVFGRLRPSSEIELELPANKVLTLPFTILNVGRASARDLLVNFAFPDGFKLANVKAPPIESPEFVIDPDNGRPLWTLRIPYVHAKDQVYLPTAIEVPAGASEVIIDAQLTAAEARSKQQLTVRFKRKPAA